MPDEFQTGWLSIMTLYLKYAQPGFGPTRADEQAVLPLVTTNVQDLFS
jgi:hypothetical protein